MADKVIVQSPGNLSLEEFQTNVQQQEEIIGPLFAFKKDNSAMNAVTFEDGATPPNLAVLQLYNNEPPADKPGYSLICNGTCLVDGQEKKVAAYRKN